MTRLLSIISRGGFRSLYSPSLLGYHNTRKRNYATRLAGIDRNPLFDKILIANRGEIACRVMRTAQKLGIKCVAVYSEADKHAMHVKMADEAYLLGPAPSTESYLRMDKIVAIAKATGAQAVHPGYGFLSENADFAEYLAKNNISFIGPPAQAIIDMGSKSASKDIMQKAKVPVVPGYHGSNQDPKFLKDKASEIGYPVLIKAVKGGGGKGMRVVQSAAEFDDMLSSAKREAIKSFGDDRVLVEKFLVTPRHIEVQIFADKHGNALHLFERDCSIQRRHQKIIEEAPGPGITPELRASLGAKAVAAAKAVNYVGAGTVEFIMDNFTKTFYFMEMNTRLQVEHPVTEMITNTDLVEWQLEVAVGNRLPLLQDQLISPQGHAFEARIYAENPTNNFLPDTGPLLHLSTPTPSSTLRVETGVTQGDQVSVYYDPMIAKLVVKGHDRDNALKMLRSALEEFNVVGLNTNVEFLKALSAHPELANGNVETNFIKNNHCTLFPAPTTPHAESILSAAISFVLSESTKVTNSSEPNAPDAWDLANGFRLNNNLERTVHLKDSNGENVEISLKYMKGGIWNVTIKTGSSTESYCNISVESATTILDPPTAIGAVASNPVSMIKLDLENKKVQSKVVMEGNSIHVFNAAHGHTILQLLPPAYLNLETHHHVGSVVTPMSCKISQILVKPGQKVTKGMPLVVLEAMKMEHMIRAPFDGVIERLNFNVNDLVEEGKMLLAFEGEGEERLRGK